MLNYSFSPMSSSEVWQTPGVCQGTTQEGGRRVGSHPQERLRVKPSEPLQRFFTSLEPLEDSVVQALHLFRGSLFARPLLVDARLPSVDDDVELLPRYALAPNPMCAPAL
jgi:hypothetical protein